MTLVMGMDQHRAQISAEWIDTITGEISTARIAPADRATVRRFLTRFDGGDLEVALEATTGWRFLVEELQRVGADAHLAEPAETSGLKGKKRRAKTDWADARHLRELLLIGRLPESWIAPAHLLDLRARVRCRHTVVEQRTEWQQRMHAVLYHHGVPHARKLLTLANRERIAALKLPATAREQLTIALEMIDAIELQVGPVDVALRAYARQHPGCRTLIDEIYGVGPLTSVAILAELGRDVGPAPPASLDGAPAHQEAKSHASRDHPVRMVAWKRRLASLYSPGGSVTMPLKHPHAPRGSTESNLSLRRVSMLEGEPVRRRDR